MAGFIGNISNFDPKIQDWSVFESRLRQFVVLNALESNEQKRAVLLTHLSDEAYKLLKNLTHPKSVEAVTYTELLQILNDHFTPKRSSFADKDNFYRASQEDGESVEDWAARLRGLAVHCEFGGALDTVLRDRLVLGLIMGPERDRLFEQDARQLTLVRAVELAQHCPLTNTS